MKKVINITLGSIVFAIEQDVTRGPAVRQLKEFATILVDPDSPDDWTQALMELGAMVCLPKAPKCLICPINELCEGRLQGIEQALPPCQRGPIELKHLNDHAEPPVGSPSSSGVAGEDVEAAFLREKRKRAEGRD